MKNKNIKVITLTAMTVFASFTFSQKVYSAAAPAIKPQVQSQACNYVLSPVEVVKNPNKYLNKNIAFNAEFVSYTALGLDYKPAYREASKYIGILIKRDDVKDHVIPLSEMKLFIKRETAEKNTDLEQGDKVRITGTVFSNALGDPWVDVKTFTIVEKKKKDTTETKK